jgi:hypothetical protein
MVFNSAGIILKKMAQSPYKIALLDKKQGRIESIIYSSESVVGSLITYSLKKQQGYYAISDNQLLYMPLSLGKTDLLFFHHVLELIYYFAPTGSCVSGVFDLLAFLYTAEHMLMSVQCKKFFLLKLLTLLGASPDWQGLCTVGINQLNQMAVTQCDSIIMDTTTEKELDRWLWCCVWQHPYVNEFKTVHFLEKNRTL